MRIPFVLFSSASLATAGALVIEDFNDVHKGQTTLGQKLGDSAKAEYWYGYNDWNHGKAGLGTTIQPDVVHEDTGFRQAIADDCGDGSACLHVTFVGGTGFAYPFSGVGFHFLREGTDVDLSSMDSITFRAKGKGAFRFKLMTKHITDDFDIKNYWADMGRTFRLTPAWRSYRMSVDDIVPQAGAPLADTVTWQECMDHVRKIHLTTSENFRAHDTLDLWIDDIVMHGVAPAVFGRHWTEDSSSVVRDSRASEALHLTNSGSKISWDPRRVGRVHLFDCRGIVLAERGGEEGSIDVSPLPRGPLLARIELANGSIFREWVVHAR